MIIAVVYLVVAVGVAVFYGGILDRRLQGPRLRAAWADGLTAVARCTVLRREEGQDAEGVPVVRGYATLEFHTADGRTVSFEERQARLTPAEGEYLTVYYSARNPEAATTRAPSFVPRHTRALTAAVGSAFAVVSATVLAMVL
ncbi:DUF3592 domain-containing protein [Streptomyces sp. NBC_00846]|uniref:DUF3592 domain-containing protein n=1 Tax=Streptomyces sp. NBC_00846 TaxID=2975849 RepID=UPI003869AE88|nr:DUF3592 domain-containing protein [Streptomyces sp. NBC_00846]